VCTAGAVPVTRADIRASTKATAEGGTTTATEVGIVTSTTAATISDPTWFTAALAYVPTAEVEVLARPAVPVSRLPVHLACSSYTIKTVQKMGTQIKGDTIKELEQKYNPRRYIYEVTR
jgi:hypothetical protein